MITFPGHGTPGKNCGEDVVYGCWDCGDRNEDDPYFSITSQCMKKSCPNCYEDWAARQGAHAAGRMTEFLNNPIYLNPIQDLEGQRWIDAQTDDDATVEERRFYRIQTYHISISFKDIDIHDGEDIKTYRHIARDIGRSHGLFGECSIPHQRDKYDDGAHFHFLALAGFITPGRDDGENYILKVIKSRGSWYPRDFLARFNVVKYDCTHAILTTDDVPTHCVTWSGCVANNKFPGRAEIDHIPQEVCCPKCNGHLTFKVVDRDWHFREDVETWVSPDRPPPGEPQKRLRTITA